MIYFWGAVYIEYNNFEKLKHLKTNNYLPMKITNKITIKSTLKFKTNIKLHIENCK